MTTMRIGFCAAIRLRSRDCTITLSIWAAAIAFAAGCTVPSPAPEPAVAAPAGRTGAGVQSDVRRDGPGGTASEYPTAPPGSTDLVTPAPIHPPSERSERAPPRTAPRLDRENSIYFSLGSVDIDEAGWNVIRRHAEKLKANRRLQVTLFGHTDHLGSREYNVALGQKRVAAVEKALRASGVPSRQIRKNSYGYEKAMPSPCGTDACRQHLRRVELRYLR